MYLKRIHLTAIAALAIASCGNKKEQLLEQKERDLEFREQQFAVKQLEYENLLALRDSIKAARLQVADTTEIASQWPDSLAIIWNCRMIAKESGCKDYIIGDKRSETWKFATSPDGIVMQVVNNDKIVRVFRGSFGKEIRLYNADSLTSNKLKIDIRLNDIQKNLIKGTQVITGQNKCLATFSVELTPSPKK